MLILIEDIVLDKSFYNLLNEYNIDIKNFTIKFEVKYTNKIIYLFTDFICEIQNLNNIYCRIFTGYAYFNNKIYKVILFRSTIYDLESPEAYEYIIILRAINENKIISFYIFTKFDFYNCDKILEDKIKEIKLLISNENLVRLFDLLYNYKLYDLKKDNIVNLNEFYINYILSNIWRSYSTSKIVKYNYLEVNIDKKNKLKVNIENEFKTNLFACFVI